MLQKVANQLADSLLSQGISQSNRKYKHSINRPAYSEGLNKQPRQLSFLSGLATLTKTLLLQSGSQRKRASSFHTK